MSRTATIGLDIGGTKAAGGLLSQTNEILARVQHPTAVDGRRDPGLRVTRQVAEELAGRAAELGLSLDGIGAGFPEYVDPSGRLASHEVLEWTAQPLDLLADIGPVTVDSDVRCAALGEGIMGMAQGLESYAYVIVGTGLSYALVERGRARAGARGEAIGLGELEVSRSVDPSASVSLERYASGEGIRERYLAAGGRAAGAAEVFEAAANGEARAEAIVDSAARAIGVSLATVASILDPGAFVLGGGVASSTARWRDALEQAYLARAGVRPHPAPLLWATLGSDAGIIGAVTAHRLRAATQAEDDA